MRVVIKGAVAISGRVKGLRGIASAVRMQVGRRGARRCLKGGIMAARQMLDVCGRLVFYCADGR